MPSDMSPYLRTDITQAELESFDNVMQTSGFRCDDWAPTLKEVEEKIIGRYQDVSRRKLEAIMQSQASNTKPDLAEYKREMKLMLMFMRWILATCDTLEPAARARLEEFVSGKLNIMNGENT